jgi:hypothetical protein
VSDEKWREYKVIIETDETGAKALVLVLKTKDPLPFTFQDLNNAQGITVRNLAIVRVSNPFPLLRRQKEEPVPAKIPNIIFTKINPTKYQVDVRGANAPYMLVFLEAFNKNWKLFLKDGSSEKLPVSKSYFGGQVQEGESKDSFFDGRTLETWTSLPIDEKNQYSVNGYANGWYLTPADTGRKTDYTLILEMTSQRQLYILLSLSLATIAICTAWVIKPYLLKRKKV